MDSISANNNVPCVLSAVLGLNMYATLGCIHTDNTFAGQNPVFELEVVEENLQEHPSIDKDLGIAGSVSPESTYTDLESYSK